MARSKGTPNSAERQKASAGRSTRRGFGRPSPRPHSGGIFLLQCNFVVGNFVVGNFVVKNFTENTL